MGSGILRTAMAETPLAQALGSAPFNAIHIPKMMLDIAI